MIKVGVLDTQLIDLGIGEQSAFLQTEPLSTLYIITAEPDYLGTIGICPTTIKPTIIELEPIMGTTIATIDRKSLG